MTMRVGWTGGIRTRLATAAVAMLLLSPGARADYDAGLAAYAAGDYAAALSEWGPLAEAGDAASQYGLGLIHESGRGVGRDYDEAAHWYLLAAEAGHPGAQFALGHLYRLGTGVTPDMAQAVRWWRAAAEQGLSQAQLALGVAYQRGEGTASDPEEAVFWFRQAADSGNPTADYALGLAYENGAGVPRDLELARAHYEKAAAGGIEPALVRLGALSFPATEEEPPPPPGEDEVAARVSDGMDEVADAPEPATPVPGEPRYIQIAAYVDEQRAERAWNELLGKHGDLLGDLPHRVLAVDLGGNTGRVYRLQAGPMPDAGEAEAICALLKSRNTDCFLVEP